MLHRFSIVVLVAASTIAPIVASAGGRAAACDRIVLRAAATHPVAVSPLQLIAPTNITAFGNAPCRVQTTTAHVAPQARPLAVAPLTLVPIHATAVFVPAKVHAASVRRSTVAVRAAAVRPLVVRPLVVRPSRSRSITRVRTLVR